MVRYNDLDWDINPMPIGSSTPDDLFETSYSAQASCPECGNPIIGTANYWSREDGGEGWLENIHYEPCEFCPEDDELDEEEDGDDDNDI